MRRMLVIAMLLIAVTALAAEKKQQPETQEKPKAKKQVTQKTPEWPRPYKSKEQISADSVVAFPVDI